MIEHHVLGLSGGKDSAALAIYMREIYPEINMEYFFTDTGKELPEVYEFLSALEVFLGKPIKRLKSHRDFDFWLRGYNFFLPSPQTRWCTRQLKILPFRQWIRPMQLSGKKVTSYVAIRSDEEKRSGYSSEQDDLIIRMPFREDGIDNSGVLDILKSSGLNYPKYYEWRSRSGCTFCFFQKKIEWVRLKERHPEAFQEAKYLENIALARGTPFTWSMGESLEELEKPERMIQIREDFDRIKMKSSADSTTDLSIFNHALPFAIDEIFADDADEIPCLICHK